MKYCMGQFMKDFSRHLVFHSDHKDAMTAWHKDLLHFCRREQLHSCSTYAECCHPECVHMWCLSYLSCIHMLQKWSELISFQFHVPKLEILCSR
jgi:hypothetical protein